MPVFGHAVVGLAIATWTHPQSGKPAVSLSERLGPTLWAPLVIGVSYLPDIVAQCGQFVIGRDLRQMTHAVPMAIVLALLVAPVVIAFYRQEWTRTFAVIVGAVIVHDLLDFLQATNRIILWPLSAAAIGPEQPVIPREPWPEALVFLVGYALAVAAYRWTQSNSISVWPISPFRHNVGSRLWLNRIVTTVIVGAAIVTHQLRAIREAQLEQARALAHTQHAYPEALATLNLAERWPSTAKPGRIDYLRAWTYKQLNDRKRAESYYLRSYQADPTYFWTIADLALFYASSDEPSAHRRQAIVPYLRRLQNDFYTHPHLPLVLTQIELLLTRHSRGAPTLSSLAGEASSR